MWKGYTLLDEGTGKFDRALLFLSPGGTDAVTVREFDLTTLAFVKDGFALPKNKQHVCYKSRDVLLVGTDFGDGKSFTASGQFPRIRRTTHSQARDALHPEASSHVERRA